MVEPEVTINNQWSDRYTVIEVSGLDRPGLLYQLTTAISKLNLNIASAHVATFGERARDVFYVTDLLGAQINAPTRQAAIKSALIHLLASEDTVRRSRGGVILEARPADQAADLSAVSRPNARLCANQTRPRPRAAAASACAPARRRTSPANRWRRSGGDRAGRR